MKQKVLIVGAGNRVKNTILPALKCLSPFFEVVGLCHRTGKKISDFNCQRVDTVIVAVTLTEVPEVLKQLGKFPNCNFRLFLDTPVLAYYHFPFLKLINRFPNVTVSEESFYLPPVKLVKQLVSKGEIGQIQQVNFLNFSYRNHPLAIARHFLNTSLVTKIVVTKSETNGPRLNFHFLGGVLATIAEPQDFYQGAFIVKGNKGTIIVGDLDLPATIKIGYKISKGIYRGLTVNKKAVLLNNFDNLYFRKIDKCVFDKNLIKSLKIRGFMDLLIEGKTYFPLEGFYDQIATETAIRLGSFWDRPFGNSSLWRKTIEYSPNFFPA